MIHYQKFTNRLTKWLDKEDLDKFTSLSQRFSKRWYDKTYLIKSNGKKDKPRYAIFVKQDNKLRRTSDMSFIKSVNFGDLLLKAIKHKREGVSILKTVSNYL